MGKASKFFKSLFGFKPSDPTHPQPPPPPPPSHSYVDKPPKRRWSFIKSHKDKLHHHLPDDNPSLYRPRNTPLHHHQSSDQTVTAIETTRSTNHPVPIAPNTAAVAEATVAEAHAAAEVVRMTTRATGGYRFHREWAAIRIQSYFRGYLSRKALRALKALVKLQALVRGHILRKQAAIDLRRLQALLRVQARARAGRFQIAESPTKGPPTPEKLEHVLRTRKEKILEMDTGKHHLLPPRRRNLFQPDNYSHSYSYSHSQSLTNSRGSTIHPPGLSPSESCEVNSVTTPYKEEVSFYVAQNSPTYGTMKVGPFTPAKSDSSRSCVSGYSDHPNYMAYTESSRAKVRSLSAPRQRPQFELPSGIKRYSVYGYGSGPQRGSNLRDSFVSKAYPGSGRLDRLGMPVGGFGIRESEFSGSYWNYQQ